MARWVAETIHAQSPWSRAYAVPGPATQGALRVWSDTSRGEIDCRPTLDVGHGHTVHGGKLWLRPSSPPVPILICWLSEGCIAWGIRRLAYVEFHRVHSRLLLQRGLTYSETPSERT